MASSATFDGAFSLFLGQALRLVWAPSRTTARRHRSDRTSADLLLKLTCCGILTVTMSPSRPFAAIVFDLDGTLVDSIGDIADGANKALAALGRPPRSVADYHKLYVRRSWW